jgi:hypothetical protein
MNKTKLFAYLKKRKSSELIKLLDGCYNLMKTRDIDAVFGHIESKLPINKSPNDGKKLFKIVDRFRDASFDGEYYAPFDINSKNYMNVPEETDMWFEKLSDLLTDSTNLSNQGYHINAVKCFEILFMLMENVDRGEEIVFADELGMWMLPINEEPCINAYFKSAAAIYEPDKYVKAVLPLIRTDGYSSFKNKAYEKAKRAASKSQKLLLDSEIIRHEIRTIKGKKS